MRTITLHKHFEKRYSKLPKKVKEQFKRRKDILISEPNNPVLGIHILHGKFGDCSSFNVTGDVRVVFKEIKKDRKHTSELQSR